MWLLTTGIAVKSPVAVKNHIGGRAFWGKQATLEHWGLESVIQWRNRFRFRLWISGIDFDSDPGVK